MKIIVDTSVWSLAFRKQKLSFENKKSLENLSELINDLKVIMIGPIRQEILSGISDYNKYQELKDKLSALSDFNIKTNDYETAAHFYNLCRKNGVQGSHIDLLICAVGYNNSFPIFTFDKDFVSYRIHIPIKIYNEIRE
jgi:predicted nucleic acid-binding protein